MMWKALKTVGLSMLSSKKFVAALIGAGVWGFGKLGWSVDDQTLMGMVSPLLAYILGQAHVDAAKVKAEIAKA
jgi:DMSO reductase anchor subunit